MAHEEITGRWEDVASPCRAPLRAPGGGWSLQRLETLARFSAPHDSATVAGLSNLPLSDSTSAVPSFQAAGTGIPVAGRVCARKVHLASASFWHPVSHVHCPARCVDWFKCPCHWHSRTKLVAQQLMNGSWSTPSKTLDMLRDQQAWATATQMVLRPMPAAHSCRRQIPSP